MRHSLPTSGCATGTTGERGLDDDQITLDDVAHLEHARGVEAAAKDVVAESQGVVVGVEAGDADGLRQVDGVCSRLGSGTTAAGGVLSRTRPRSTSGLGPSAIHGAEIFFDGGRGLRQGRISPMSTMVVRSGRKAMAYYCLKRDAASLIAGAARAPGD